MKYHKSNPANKSHAKCMKGFGRVNAQNYAVVSDAEFAEIEKTQPGILCKKCKSLN